MKKLSYTMALAIVSTVFAATSSSESLSGDLFVVSSVARQTGQDSSPLTLSQIEALIDNKTPDTTIAIEIEKRGIGFTPTSEDLRQLTLRGIGPKTLQALGAPKLTPSSDAERLYSRGWELINKGRLIEAEDTFRKLRLSPQSAKYYSALGWCLYKQAETHPPNEEDLLKEANESFRKAISLEPENGSHYNALGWTLYAQVKTAEARDIFLKSVNMKFVKTKDRADAYFGLGLAYERLDVYSQALSACEAALRLDNTNADYKACVDRLTK